MYRHRRLTFPALACLMVPATLISGCSSNLDCPADGASNTLVVSFPGDLPPGSIIEASCEATEACFGREAGGDEESRTISFPGSVPDETTITVKDASGTVIYADTLRIPWKTEENPCGSTATAEVTLEQPD